MILPSDKSLCSTNQKIIVSRDKGTSRKHQAINPAQQYVVRQYKLDGEIVKNSFRRFKDQCGSKLKYQTNFMEEIL